VDHLRGLGVLDAGGLSAPRLGGWLKMGLVGTVPAHGNVLLVGDAAGLTNPLQGEGISQALGSGRAAAEMILSDPATAADRYRRWVADTLAPYAEVAAPVHAALVGGGRRVSATGRLLTAPGVRRLLAPTWALYWNDLRDGAPRNAASVGATLTHAVGRAATVASRTRRDLRRSLT